MAPRRLNSYVSLIAIFLVVDTLLLVALAELTFGPEDPNNNEVIFEGENVTLICRVTDVTTGEIVTFDVTRGQTNIIIKNVDVSGGAISQFETMDNEIRFVLPFVKVSSTTRFNCAVTSSNQMTQMKFYALTVSPSNATQCRQNSTYEKLSTDTLRLSCYYLSSFYSDNLVWIKTDSNGISSELTTDLTVVSNNKRLLVSYVQPSEELSPSNYFCQTSANVNPRLLEPSQGCNAGSFVVYSQPLVTFSPNRQSIAAGESRNVTCINVSIQGALLTPIWPGQMAVKNVSFDTLFGSNILQITVSDSVKDGTLIDITCTAFVGTGRIPYTLTLTVGDSILTSTLPSINMQTGSEGPGTNETPNQPLSTMLLVIIAGTGVAFILAVVLSVILCYCMCKKGEVVENEQQDFAVLYGKVLRRSQRSNDGTLDRKNTSSFEYSRPVTYDNNGGVSSSQSLTNLEDNNTDDNNVIISQPDDKYDRVNHSINHDVDENRDDEEENPYGDDAMDDVPNNPDYY
ncbi:hypothetical protein BSL78_00611 [Apostichopus japonicus]|uniref:Ig-like domain-containing protein n=1 Tax=Stichopus japonicus TaxID=307972 RepID=A0A2G8LQA7_STIJA|nr:hypothetical protein BSL78_00611 [Apostichopus japonicus]